MMTRRWQALVIAGIFLFFIVLWQVADYISFRRGILYMLIDGGYGKFIPLVLFVILFIAGAIFCYRSEKKEWNNGACSCEKGFWIQFDMSSQGDVGYKCSEPSCNHTIWLSWMTFFKEL